jgi:hypothetical protein
MTKAFLLLCAVLLPIPLAAQTPNSHHTGVYGRGDAVMGFSHETTTHRFTLLAGGGTIAVSARDAADRASISKIRSHLTHIASMFADGNFEAPMLIHAITPPGVAMMRERTGAITYTFEETATGGRIRVTTADRAAVDAVHAFLRFQIEDHRTGDPKRVQPK